MNKLNFLDNHPECFMFEKTVEIFEKEMESVEKIKPYMTHVTDFDNSYDLTDIHPKNRKNLLMYIIFFKKNDELDDKIKNRFPMTYEYIQKIPGVIDTVCIAIAPNSIMPLHIDDMEKGLYQYNDWYSVFIGVKVPSSDSNLLGVEIDKIIYNHSEKNAIVFDTQCPHRAWNNTNDWWISLRFNVKKSFFKIKEVQ